MQISIAYRNIVGNLPLAAMHILKTIFLDRMAAVIDFVPMTSALQGPNKIVVMPD